MAFVYAIHILGGSLGLVTGFIALYAAKGAPLHRRSGMAFVVAMLTMCLFGGVIAIVRGAATAINLPAAILTGYLVITALTTVRPPVRGTRALHLGLMAVALVVGVVVLRFGFEAIASGGARKGMPAFPFFLFGLMGVLGSVGDLRLLRAGRIAGAPRLTRHLWRMTMALLVSSMSFFLGQAKVIPKPIRIYPLLMLPILAVLVTLLYWLWRVRLKRSLRGTLVTQAPEAV